MACPPSIRLYRFCGHRRGVSPLDAVWTSNRCFSDRAVRTKSYIFLGICATRTTEECPCIANTESVAAKDDRRHGKATMGKTLIAVMGILLTSCAMASPTTDTDIPRAEHPRPDFQRAQWLNLNGTWQFRFDPKDVGLKQQWWTNANAQGTDWKKQIVVPFGWESELSKVHQTEVSHIGWYRREADLPAEWKGKTLWLHIGAADWEARVWVNGSEVGTHRGGYTPLEFDITGAAKAGSQATIVVRVYDPQDPELPGGLQHQGHTSTSGIWQTVWIEPRAEVHLASVRLTPRKSGNAWLLGVEATIHGPDGNAVFRIKPQDATVPTRSVGLVLKNGTARAAFDLEIEQPQLWSPDDPHLYKLELQVESAAGGLDVVDSYFGLRTIGRGRYGQQDHESILLNGRPLFLRGVLSQAFNPRGIYTAPSDEFLQRDVELAKSMGFNCIRLHVKPAEPRFLYWADRLGMLIIEDMPSTAKHSPRARAQWRSTMREVIARDYNHPSIIAWCLFNQSWGIGNGEPTSLADSPQQQAWVEQQWKHVKEVLDPFRLVIDNSSGPGDHVISDLNTWHVTENHHAKSRARISMVVRQTYPGSTFNYVPGKQQDTAPLLNTQFGPSEGRGADLDVSWPLRTLITQMRRHEKNQGYVYRMLSDVEGEHTGVLNYDRSEKQFGYKAFFPKMTLADLQGDDFVGFDSPPVIEAVPGSEVTLPIFISHFSTRRESPKLRWWLAGMDNLGRKVKTAPQIVSANWHPYRTTFQRVLRIDIPKNRRFVGAICLELLDFRGVRIAANYVNVLARDAHESTENKTRLPSPRVQVIDSRTVALRFKPGDYSRFTSKNGPREGQRSDKVFAYGPCRIEYRLHIPQFVIDAVPDRIQVLTEVGTKAKDERLDWPTGHIPVAAHYPQTQDSKHSGTLNILLAGKPLWQFRLPDDPADSRGVLSHHGRYHLGSYGYLIKKEVNLVKHPTIPTRLRVEPVMSITFEVPAGPQAAGLSIYGERLGRFPIDPTLIIHTAENLTKRVGWTSYRPVAVQRQNGAD